MCVLLCIVLYCYIGVVKFNVSAVVPVLHANPTAPVLEIAARVVSGLSLLFCLLQCMYIWDGVILSGNALMCLCLCR